MNGIVFSLNDEIKKSYDEAGIAKFLAQYCEEEGQKWSVKKEYVNPNTLFTILYYFFINNYEVSNDDYIGKYYITKRETDLEH